MSRPSKNSRKSNRPIALVRLALARPKTVLGAWLLITAVAAAFALQLDSALTAGGFSDPRSESARAQTLIQKAFGDAPNQTLVVLDRAGRISDADIDAATTVLHAFGATRVDSPATNPALRSNDGHTIVLAAGFPGSNASVQDATPRLQHALDAKVSARTYLTGQPALDYQLNVYSKEDATRAELIAFPVLILVLLFVFRSVVATVVPLVLAGGALAIAQAVGFFATHITDISILYTNIVSMVGLAVAVDYSLFIIKRFREELADGTGTRDALHTAFSTAGRSVLYSGIAVAVALLALFIPGLMAFTSIALGGIVVTAVALLLSLSALPAALVLLGPRIAWGAIRTPRWMQRRSRVRTSSPSRARRIVPGLVAAGILIAIATPLLGVSLQSPVASATILPRSDLARTGLDLAQQNVGSRDLFPIQVVLSAPRSMPIGDFLRQVDAMTREAGAHHAVSTATSVLSTGASSSQLAEAISASGGIPAKAAALLAVSNGDWVARVFVTARVSPDSVAAHRLVSALRDDPVDSEISRSVAGATAQGLDFDSALERSIPLIVAFVFALTFVMLLVAFRSAVLPLLALGFNLLVVGASLGILTLFTRLSTNDPINSVTPVLLFAVLFGLSMDYLVIIISRVIEAGEANVTFDDAVTIGTTKTRAMVNSAAVIMVAVFASFTSAQISIVREIGIGLGVAVILDALVIRMLVMPAVLRLVGPRALPRALSATAFPPAKVAAVRMPKTRDV